MKAFLKFFSFLLAVLFLCGNLCFCATAAGNDAPIDGSEFAVSKADNWTNLFFHPNETQKTWLGADGIYSVALDGNDRFGSAGASTTTFFIFSDTLMGTSDNQGHLIENAGMPSTTSAYLKGNSPDDSKIQYVYGNGGSMAMGGQNLFGERLWMLDCLVLNNNIYCFGFTPSGDWKPENLKVAVIPVKNGDPDYGSYADPVDVSRYLWHRDRNYLYAYGVGIFNNTAAAGAPDPDGYLYLYGYRDALREGSRKDMIVSRIKATDFPTYTYDPDNKHNYKPDFSKIEYFDGENWSKDITRSAPIIRAVSCEFSVSPIPSGKYAGKYIAVYTHNTEGSEICYAIGDTPYGPFDTPRIFYHAPEHGQTGTSGYGTRYVYNAKAHPHLSRNGKLLVSYNCNVRDVMMNDQTSADYHPRFLWLDLGEGGTDTPPPVSSEASSEVSSNVSSDVSSDVSSEVSSEVSSAVSSDVSSDAVSSDTGASEMSSDEASADVPSSDGTPSVPSEGQGAVSPGGSSSLSSNSSGSPVPPSPPFPLWVLVPIAGAVAVGGSVLAVVLLKKK